MKIKSIQKNEAVQRGKKRGTQQNINYSKLSLRKAHLKNWGSTSLPPTPTRLPTINLCCQSGRKTWILYRRSALGTNWRTGNLKFPRQLHGAPRDLSFPFAGVGTIFATPRSTKSRRSNRQIIDAPLFHDIGNSHLWP